MEAKHKKAEKDYIQGMKYKDIADKYEVSINTVKSWKRRHGWERNKGAPKEKSVHTKRGGQPGNKNAIGNPGGAAPKRNTNAVKHGLFAKYLPEETLEIVNEIDSIAPLDILWMNIKMQFASIMRAQQIMFVEDKYDLTKEVKKTETADGDNFSTEKNEWEIQFAWDKQANFLNSQSRAMGELRSMLKQFYELANYDDDRLLEVERMRAVIDKTKAETEKLSKDDNSNTPPTITIVDAWSEENE
ncbi:phage terminase small subunit [Virgibacillus chiguensis]|uniref:Uncharacterized protein YjcR n=1 Tax=Virgibacillus chiguensis TaxID=411959 RepID=A0A1M5XR12_9BACI|nr:phage terminase small subunit [Virgibacillus chiguensis]SHI01974.1 Uncharacterized protein YjcR [Virgibacillus chiguensis]